MKSPMTSPWSAVLTSSATMTFTPNSAAFSRASSAPVMTLWSVTAIAPSPWSRAVASSTSTGVAQSCEWSVCMCRSTSMRGRVRSRNAISGLPASGWRRADEARVDLLELVGDARPRQALAQRRGLAHEARAQRGLVDEPLQLGGERVDVARLEQQAVVADAERLLVDRQARREHRDLGVQRAQHEPGRGRGAVGGGDEHVGAARARRPRRARRASRSARAPAARRAAACCSTARARRRSSPPTPRRRSRRRSARRNSRSAARSSSSTNRIRGGAVGAARAAAAARRRRAAARGSRRGSSAA